MNRLMSIRVTTAAALLSAPATSYAQSDVDASDKFAWGENIGWTNWRDAGSPAGMQGAVVHDTFLAGFVWAENVGWINLGDGTPANGTVYANATGADFGVNRDLGTGNLSGRAWGENIGWLNFAAGALTIPANNARIVSEGGACRLRGFVWGENVGWISLDGDTHFVGLPGVCDEPCDLVGDVDDDGDVDLQDLAYLLGHFGTISGATEADGDLEGDGDVELQDLALLLANFGMSCP